MAVFPKIQSPCPYQSRLASVMDGDFCRMCRRQVFDLTAFSDAERRAFLAGCGEEVCVSYSLRPALAAAALAAAAALPGPALAQDAAPAGAEAPAAAAMATEADSLDMIRVVAGGIRPHGELDYIDTEAEAALPELPVLYEDEKPGGPANGAGLSDTAPVSPPAGS